MRRRSGSGTSLASTSADYTTDPFVSTVAPRHPDRPNGCAPLFRIFSAVVCATCCMILGSIVTLAWTNPLGVAPHLRVETAPETAAAPRDQQRGSYDEEGRPRDHETLLPPSASPLLPDGAVAALAEGSTTRVRERLPSPDGAALRERLRTIRRGGERSLESVERAFPEWFERDDVGEATVDLRGVLGGLLALSDSSGSESEPRAGHVRRRANIRATEPTVNASLSKKKKKDAVPAGRPSYAISHLETRGSPFVG